VVCGRAGFYKGPVAEAIVKELKGRGGVMAPADLEGHTTEAVEPISTTYRWGRPLAPHMRARQHPV
jgi:gamma-glutamyltranspeptidase